SYDAGVNWTGPCFTNNFSTQRQDVTGLELSNMGGGNTRIIAAIGTRGFATTVQYDLGNNGANGLYSATMGSSGCPSFTSIASNRSEEHTSELQSLAYLVCRLLLEKKKQK